MTGNDKRQISASRIREARRLAGLSQGQVAKMLGLQRPSVTEIEAGNRAVAAEELAKSYGDLLPIHWKSFNETLYAYHGEVRVKPIPSWNSPRLLMAYAAFFFDVVVSIFSSRFNASRSLGRCRSPITLRRRGSMSRSAVASQRWR